MINLKELTVNELQNLIETAQAELISRQTEVKELAMSKEEMITAIESMLKKHNTNYKKMGYNWVAVASDESLRIELYEKLLNMQVEVKKTVTATKQNQNDITYAKFEGFCAETHQAIKKGDMIERTRQGWIKI